MEWRLSLRMETCATKQGAEHSSAVTGRCRMKYRVGLKEPSATHGHRSGGTSLLAREAEAPIIPF